MSKLSLVLIFSIFLIEFCSAAPNPDYGSLGVLGKHGTMTGDLYGSGLGLGAGLGAGMGHGIGFGEDCRTEATIRLQRCIEDYDESPEMFFRRLNFFGRASKDTCCKFYKIRRCLRKSLYELNNCRDVVDSVVASRMNYGLCDGYIETDCYLPIWAIILLVIFGILFLGCLVSGIVFLLRRRQNTT